MYIIVINQYFFKYKIQKAKKIKIFIYSKNQIIIPKNQL